jgi:hypothetical protein
MASFLTGGHDQGTAPASASDDPRAAVRRSDVNDSEFRLPNVASMLPRASIVAQNAIHLAGGVTDNSAANCPDPKS